MIRSEVTASSPLKNGGMGILPMRFPEDFTAWKAVPLSFSTGC
jgi:hypothetical protein